MLARRFVPAIAVLLALAIGGMAAAAAPAAGPHVCRGTFHKPGVLKGSYPHGVIVRGVCAVKAGKAHVFGTLTVTKRSALAAIFGRHHSSLKVTGNLVVERGGVVFLGCKVNPDGSGIPCFDDPSMTHPTLKSHEVITGSIIEHSPLGVIVHNSSIGHNITESGGGGGLSCAPPKKGVFAKIGSPVYSDYEDTRVGGKLTISRMKSCWLGLARDKIRGSVRIAYNKMGDPDAIEILSTHIRKNLTCVANSHPSGPPRGKRPVWDSVDTGHNVYPRIPEPNTVGGRRRGQCVKASPSTQGGPPGPGPF